MARAVFGAGLPIAQRYARLLAGPGVHRGLVGPAEADRIWERHILNCAAVAELIPPDAAVVDLGSGAGLPGIVLAIRRPAAAVTLLEPMARRVAFLQECADLLGLANVTVLRGRAEELAGRLAADVVTARAVAPLDRLAGLAAGLARQGGVVLAIKGARAVAEVAHARPELDRLGFRAVSIVEAGSGTVVPAATVVRMVTGRPRRGAASGRSAAARRRQRDRGGERGR